MHKDSKEKPLGASDLLQQSQDYYKDYYKLSLEDRFSTYRTLVIGEHFRRQETLKSFCEKEKAFPLKRLTSDELTEELSDIIPTFRGNVIGRSLFPSTALHYILDPRDMITFFADSAIGTTRSRVVGKHDNLLRPDHNALAGCVILQAQQQTEREDTFVTLHETAHVKSFHLPNGMRREAYQKEVFHCKRREIEKCVETIIALDQAIAIDEAAACVESYAALQADRRNSFVQEFIDEWSGYMHNVYMRKLEAFKRNSHIKNSVKTTIAAYERARKHFPRSLLESTLSLAKKLRNPQHTECLGYALSHVREALDILDYHEIPQHLETLCLNVVEPHRLYGQQSYPLTLFAKVTEHHGELN
ncbi:hypothetical protein HY772_07800 [Candidatus Woesearchaeota archaeon]|nr:hypothetical protein [Candidatus Woesearchaeota archaeon]